MRSFEQNGWRAFLTVGLMLGAVTGCGADSGEEPVVSGRALTGGFGDYDVTTTLNDPASPRGWTIEWKIPQILNPDHGVLVIGQWYNNFETGLWFENNNWQVYYYGDDNGLTGNEPSCDNTWPSGGHCHGVFENLAPGRQVTFKFELCTPAHVPDVNGTQNCAYVDLEDGHGFRFLAEDTKVRPEGPEMYAHDVEDYREIGGVMPQISCTAPTRMVRQQVKTSAGSWVTLSGASTWTLRTVAGEPYKFQNVHLDTSPATWESCSQLTASLQVTNEWEGGYCANLTVANNGPTAISNWSAVVDLAGSTMNNNWSAQFTQTDVTRYSVTPQFWNQSIAAGGSQTVGFCGNKTQSSGWMPFVVDEYGG
ncbi:MAG TPA: cellulose binding domain-containing protein [Polyangia bacterium]|nr:cellulose binding domain-containing protein [Polyangia bacterium]